MAAGNSMDTVSKFIGHADVRTTSSFYWTPQAEELDKMMINPFTGGKEEKTFPSEVFVQAANAKAAAARKIVDALLSVSDANALANLSKILPDYKDTLATIDAADGDQNPAPSEPFLDPKTEDFEAPSFLSPLPPTKKARR
jgi:hypothetical protein